MKYYIFDLDNTLYKLNENMKIVNTIDIILLNKLKTQGTIIMFSNATYSHCDYWCSILNIKEYFPTIISADNLQHTKPNPLSYEKVIELCNIKETDNVYFFDDIPINLYSASKYNWNTYLINKENNMKKYIENKNHTEHTNNQCNIIQFDDINSCIESILSLKK
jgi:FMN phosphatase YigB (HAD superfamily)